MADRNPVPRSDTNAYEPHGAPAVQGDGEFTWLSNAPVTREADGSAVKTAITAAGKGPRPAPKLKRGRHG